ncbi:hypothetical protein RhiirA4_548587 [Rhizophagus irregularis]|uniref:Uncharacterized protein n=1 Tax=Rhizophagus irregularis TaxID=588596 RepID=A0A2I1H8G4_9GLOM|nr:hypothetical protein RhiirA4_548587 [Rhizophagus irregularis]
MNRIPSNVPSYASLTIRKRRNNRRHRITIDTIRVGRLPTQITNNPSLHKDLILLHNNSQLVNYTATQAVDYLGQAHKWTDTDVVSSYKENMCEPCSDARIND